MSNSDDGSRITFLPLCEVPMGWEVSSIGAICRIEMGQSPPSATYNRDQIGLPFFQGKAEFGRLYPEVEKYCSEPKKVAPEGSILLSVRAPVGPTNIAPTDSCIGRGLAAVQPMGGTSTKYILYYFRAIEPDLSGAGTGSTFKAINGAYLRSIEVNLPPINEQRRIVAKIEELFSELDNGVESLKAARAQLKTYRQSLLKAAFEGRLTEQWRCDNAEKLESADEILERIREAHSKQEINGRATVGAELNKEKAVETRPRAISISENDRVALPTGWITLDLGSFVRSIDAGKSYKCEERPPEEGEYGLAKISAVTWGKYDERESKTCTRTDFVNDRYLIRDGDFLISRANTIELVGACVIAEGISRNIMLSDKILRLNFLGVNERYVMFYLWSEMGRAEIERRASGNQMSMRNIGQERIRAIPIPIPSIAEQNAIVEQVESGLSKAEAILAEIDAALDRVGALRRSILKRAFEGKLVPQDPDDEPASALLERIRPEQEKEPKSAKGRRKANA